LAAVRAELGDEAFETFMDDFGRAHAGRPTATSEFVAAAEEAADRSLAELFEPWLKGERAATADTGNFWSIDSFEIEPDRALIVYGTRQESQAQREAAELLQRKIARRWSNITPPIRSEDDVSDDDLRDHHLLLIGRPATNEIARRYAKGLPVRFGNGSFVIREETYAHAESAVVCAGQNPLNPRYEIVIYTGLGADATRRLIESLPDRGGAPAEILLLPAGQKPRRLAVTNVMEQKATKEAKK
ncbi:MAG TPA: hypothetical protein VJ783_24765, partial [Pirellulales bacterium]|nr:hypothetical protein [Pirellulales bacterium]